MMHPVLIKNEPLMHGAHNITLVNLRKHHSQGDGVVHNESSGNVNSLKESKASGVGEVPQTKVSTKEALPVYMIGLHCL